MQKNNEFAYFSLEFDREARIVEPEQISQLRNALGKTFDKPLLVLVHGWNNNIEEARSLYGDLMASFCQVCPGIDLVVLGVFWPSKRFTNQELIAGGIAAVDLGNSNDEKALEGLRECVERGEALLYRAQELLQSIDYDEGTRREFIEILGNALGSDVTHDEDELPFNRYSDHLLYDAQTAASELVAGRSGEGGIAGQTGEAHVNFGSAVEIVANLVTYYSMKRRAGKIGVEALYPVLKELAADFPIVPIHLCGHSFGARLATATLAAGSIAPAVKSLTLLQGAFSQFGLASDGAFASILRDRRIDGSIVATHTKNDLANRLAYAVASRLSGDQRAALGDENDRFGSIGANGAQRVDALAAVLGRYPYAFEAGRVTNVESSQYISGHSDVTGEEVARMLGQVIGGV